MQIIKVNSSPTAIVAAIAALLSTSWVPMVQAQSTDRNAKEIVFAPYLWLTALDGTSTVGALPPVEVDASYRGLFTQDGPIVSFTWAF